MAELAATTWPAPGGPERDLLLATKLQVPGPRPGFVPRARLAGRLAEGTGRELTLVCTPPGFGKTTLLADWARNHRRPVAWLYLDAGDNDPVRFWRHVTAALDRVRPGVGDRVAPLLRPPSPASFEGVVTALVNGLAGVAEEVVLVLDDYHLVRAPAVQASFAFLLEHLPASLRLVVASRADPPLPLARLRARGQLAELREADLRFTADEAADLLRAAVGAELPEAAVAALEDRTEGWAAGLQLAGLSLRGHQDPAGFLQGFSGSHRYVLDYLAEEVLDRQPAQLRQFLLETSVLDRLSGDLCDAVTGRADGQATLEAIDRANLFLQPLDEVRGWWRYHQLFADLLRVRLGQERPERVPELHRAAAGWHERRGLIGEAIGHARAAGDGAWAARLIERHFESLLGRSEDATLRRWLEELPAEAAGRRPRLWLAQAFWALIGGRVETVERLLDEAERAFAACGDEPYEPTVGRAAGLVANVPAATARMRAAAAHLRGDADQTLALTRQALARLDEDEWMLRSVTRWYLGMAEWLRGRPAEAERAFAADAASIARWRASGQATLAAWGYQHVGLVQHAQGHLEAALATYRELLAAAAEPGGPVLPAAGVARVGMAEVAYERGQLEAALADAAEGVALARQLGWTQPLVAGLAVLARARQARGDRDGAQAAVAEAERVGLSPAVVGLLNPVPALRARLALANGEVAQADRWVRARGLAAGDEPSYPHERDHLVLARVLLATDASGEALALLERWHALAAAQGRTGSRIELLGLRALAEAACGREPAALASLAEALALGAGEGYLQVFVDEGPPMAALTVRLLADQRLARPTAAGAVPRAHLVRLLGAFEAQGIPVLPPTRAGAVAVPGLVEPLTARELEVLRLLAVGRPNRAVAEELVVTVDTVKSHVSRLLAKLGAANRVQAVARARELGLLP
jgi:LuxR family maltose regulon positive regulatory protein